MSKELSSKALFKAALRNYELIDYAYFNTAGKINLTEENKSAVGTLIKYRLAWQFEEMEGVQLSSALLKLLEKTGNASRRIRGSGEIASLFRQLDESLEEYKLVEKKSLDFELERLSNEIYECAFEMIESIDAKLTTFAAYIDQGFTAVSDIELRLLHNQRALKEAEQLNDILLGCDLSEFTIHTSSDPTLRKLFKVYLPRSFNVFRKELVRVLHDLRKLVTKLQADSELAKQLISFRRHFERNPGFVPTEVPFIDRIPPILTQSERATSFAYPDVLEDSHTEVISSAISLVKQAISHKEAEKQEELDIQDTSNNEPSIQDIGELYEKSLAVIEVVKTGNPMSASAAYKVLEVGSDYSYWLLALLNTVDGLEKEERAKLNVDITSEEHPLFNGNLTVTDVRLYSC